LPILSIQSHVAYGYVGNKAAVFPLELLGFDVWSINTVQFSNHPGYGAWKGEIFSDRQVELVWSGIVDRGVASSCEAVLSGYLGDASIGQAVLSAVEDVKAAAPGALYCCDPVMGDYGSGLFVREGIPDFMRNQALPRADVITPNQFEAELLSDRVIGSVEDAKEAARFLRSLGPRVVLIKSFKPEGAETGTISLFLSSEEGDFVVTTPELSFDVAPHGAGDLSSALFLGHLIREKSAARALELTADSVFAVLERSKVDRSRELRLIQSQAEIARPARRFEARRV
jgi:pyridoxine kinase